MHRGIPHRSGARKFRPVAVVSAPWFVLLLAMARLGAEEAGPPSDAGPQLPRTASPLAPATATSNGAPVTGVCGMLRDSAANSLVLPMVVWELANSAGSQPLAWPPPEDADLDGLALEAGDAAGTWAHPDLALARVTGLLSRGRDPGIGALSAGPRPAPTNAPPGSPIPPPETRLIQARELLDALPPIARETARAHHLRGLLHFKQGDFAAAATSFRAAAEIEPDVPIHTVNFLAARLQSPDPATAAEADAALAAFQGTPGVTSIVLANRLAYALRTSKNDADTAPVAERLAQGVDPRSPGYLLYLDYLRRMRPAELQTAVAQTFDDPAARISVVTGWLRWLWKCGERASIVALLDRANARLNAHPEFVLLEAQIRQALGQSAPLQSCLDKPAWKAMPTACTAYRLWLARNDPSARASLAREITQNAAQEPDARLFVATLLDSWGLADVAAPVWILVAASDHPASPLAMTRVTALALKSGNTPLLLRLFEALAARLPPDPDAQLKRIYLTLLLGKASPELTQEAQTLYASKPDNSAVAAVLAYALFLSGNRSDAIQILSRCAPDSLLHRPESLITALVLQDTDPAQAKALAQSSAPFLKLPEERALFETLSQ